MKLDNNVRYVTSADGGLVARDSLSINEVSEVLVFKTPSSDVISCGKLWFLDNVTSSHSVSFCRNVVGLLLSGTRNFLGPVHIT